MTTVPDVTQATITDLGDGIHQVTHALPWALNHVHCYVVCDGASATVIDCGLGSDGTLAAWREALETLGVERVERLVVTHYHPDHLGAARLLVDAFAPGEVIQGAYDAELAGRVWRFDPADLVHFETYLTANGMPAGEARDAVGSEARLPVWPIEATRLVVEGDALTIAGDAYRVLHLDGHADGHIVLYDETRGRMFGGDVILDPITPNVGRWEDTRPDPLSRYLRTLDRLVDLAPAVVYPGHRRLIEDVPGRARQIAAHHDLRLVEHERALATGADSAWAVARIVWPALGEHERRFALAEALAHLEHLAATGRAREMAPGRFALP